MNVFSVGLFRFFKEYSPKFTIVKEIQALMDFLNFLTKGPHLFSISDNTK